MHWLFTLHWVAALAMVPSCVCQPEVWRQPRCACHPWPTSFLELKNRSYCLIVPSPRIHVMCKPVVQQSYFTLFLHPLNFITMSSIVIHRPNLSGHTKLSTQWQQLFGMPRKERTFCVKVTRSGPHTQFTLAHMWHPGTNPNPIHVGTPIIQFSRNIWFHRNCFACLWL